MTFRISLVFRRLLFFLFLSQVSYLTGQEDKSERVNSVRVFVTPAFCHSINTPHEPFHGISAGASVIRWFADKTYILETGLVYSRHSLFEETQVPDEYVFQGPYKDPRLEPAHTLKQKFHQYFISVPFISKYFLKNKWYLTGGPSVDFLVFRRRINKAFYDGVNDHVDVKSTNYLKNFSGHNISIGVGFSVGKIFRSSGDYVINLEWKNRFIALLSDDNMFPYKPFYSGILIGFEFYND